MRMGWYIYLFIYLSIYKHKYPIHDQFMNTNKWYKKKEERLKSKLKNMSLFVVERFRILI